MKDQWLRCQFSITGNRLRQKQVSGKKESACVPVEWVKLCNILVKQANSEWICRDLESNEPHWFVKCRVCQILRDICWNNFCEVKQVCSRTCPWCNGYRRRKWTWRPEFKCWTRLITFHIALIPLGKVWIQLFFIQIWVNRTDWVLQPWWGN